LLARSWFAVLLGLRLNNQNIPHPIKLKRLIAGVLEKLNPNPRTANAHMAKGMRWCRG
jgi:hypothetical protein